MLRLAALINGLLPAKERWPLAPKGTIVVRLGRTGANKEWQLTHECRVSADGTAKLSVDGVSVYENDSVIPEELAVLWSAAKVACKGTPRDGGVEEGLSVSVEILNSKGAVVRQHRDDHLHHYGEASPGAVRVIRWLNDHLPNDQRVNLASRAGP